MNPLVNIDLKNSSFIEIVMMNVKQEERLIDLPERVFINDIDPIFKEFETNTPRSEQNVEIKQEMIECKGPKSEQGTKIDCVSKPEENLQFCSIYIKNELENTSEVKARDIREGNSVQFIDELLPAHCDLPALKNENTEYPDCLLESCDGEQDEQDFNGSLSKFNGNLLKKIDNQKHLRTHTNKIPFKCNICFEEFSYKNHLYIHLGIHYNEKQLNCDICSKKYNRKCNLHTEEKHLKCDVCFKEFNRKSNLQTHLKTHTNDKPFKCDICFKEFYRKYNLQIHSKTHTNKPCKCDICFEDFINKCELQTHLKTHTNGTKFKCDICLMEFNRKSNLKAHLNTHTNDKPFKCDICFKEFYRKYNLQLHLRTHTNKPLKN